jgi:putative acetyltransferase
LLVKGIDFTQLEVFCLMGGTKVYGFLGVAESKLEMLFLDPDLFGNGYGKQMLDFAIHRLGCETVDVNEQNESARRFYEKAGFQVISRSETDGGGMSYPILHMQLPKPI